MTEYISKADVLEVVRKGANVYKSLGMISKLPTIDIVHCGECSFYPICRPICRDGILLSSNWFCAGGERKE